MKKMGHEQKTVEVVEEMTCDMCGQKTPWIRSDWSTSPHTTASTTVKMETGYSMDYDGGGESEEVEIDICPDCFNTKLIPWLESQGVKIERKKYLF